MKHIIRFVLFLSLPFFLNSCVSGTGSYSLSSRALSQPVSTPVVSSNAPQTLEEKLTTFIEKNGFYSKGQGKSQSYYHISNLTYDNGTAASVSLGGQAKQRYDLMLSYLRDDEKFLLNSTRIELCPDITHYESDLCQVWFTPGRFQSSVVMKGTLIYNDYKNYKGYNYGDFDFHPTNFGSDGKINAYTETFVRHNLLGDEASLAKLCIDACNVGVDWLNFVLKTNWVLTISRNL
jgi:hypothetical protein